MYYFSLVLKNTVRNLAEGVPALVPLYPSPSARAANLALEQETHLPQRCVMYYFFPKLVIHLQFCYFQILNLEIRYLNQDFTVFSSPFIWAPDGISYDSAESRYTRFRKFQILNVTIFKLYKIIISLDFITFNPS